MGLTEQGWRKVEGGWVKLSPEELAAEAKALDESLDDLEFEEYQRWLYYHSPEWQELQERMRSGTLQEVLDLIRRHETTIIDNGETES